MFINKKSSNLRKYGTSKARINNVIPMPKKEKTAETNSENETTASPKVCKGKRNNDTTNINKENDKE